MARHSIYAVVLCVLILIGILLWAINRQVMKHRDGA